VSREGLLTVGDLPRAERIILTYSKLASELITGHPDEAGGRLSSIASRLPIEGLKTQESTPMDHGPQKRTAGIGHCSYRSLLLQQAHL